jgi:hypothetical protein
VKNEIPIGSAIFFNSIEFESSGKRAMIFDRKKLKYLKYPSSKRLKQTATIRKVLDFFAGASEIRIPNT